MNKNQKIIISITGIVLVLLILVGLTYAYFLTQIMGNTNEKSISVTTDNLLLTYLDGNGMLEIGELIVPGNEINFLDGEGNIVSSKMFSVRNDGADTDYVVVLDEVKITKNDIETIFESNDFEYTITCINSDNTECNEVKKGVLPLEEGILVGNSIKSGMTQTYTLTMRYLEAGRDQGSDKGKIFEGRINIEDIGRINPYSANTNSLAYNIINDSISNASGTSLLASSATKVAEEKGQEKTLSITQDDFGTSYYYRGNVSNNYLNFNGMCWRIVRIEGDGSVKLVLDDQYDVCNETVDQDGDGKTYTGNWIIKDGAYGWQSGNTKIANYITGYKVNLTNWYNSKSFDNTKIKSDTWCMGDLNNVYSYSSPYSLLTSNRIDSITTNLQFNYDTNLRLRGYGDLGFYPTLQCNKKDYSYDENYVGTLTADEIVFAGGKVFDTFSEMYLINSYFKTTNKWWITLSSSLHTTTNDYIFMVAYTGQINHESNTKTNSYRPAITLKAGIEISETSGNGTISSPYVIN